MNNITIILLEFNKNVLKNINIFHTIIIEI